MRETKTRAASRGVGVGQRGGSTRAADANWPGNAAREWRWASGSRAPVAVLVSPTIAMALSLHYRLQSASLLPQGLSGHPAAVSPSASGLVRVQRPRPPCQTPSLRCAGSRTH